MDEESAQMICRRETQLNKRKADKFQWEKNMQFSFGAIDFATTATCMWCMQGATVTDLIFYAENSFPIPVFFRIQKKVVSQHQN